MLIYLWSTAITNLQVFELTVGTEETDEQADGRGIMRNVAV